MDKHTPCAMVTGAGKGLGRAIAEAFHAQGYHVVATDHDAGLLADLVGSAGYTIARLDVRSTEDAASIAAQIRAQLGRLDVIVNNAGVNAFYPVCEAPPRMTIDAFMINTFGALITTQACLDLLIETNGTVVNISSESAPLRTPFQCYQSTKAALEALSDVMRRELCLLGVHVALVRPGAIRTELLEGTHAVRNALAESRFEKFFERFARGVAKRVPKYPSAPAEVATLVLRAAADPARRPMYTINNSLLLRTLGWLPARWLDRLLERDLLDA